MRPWHLLPMLGLAATVPAGAAALVDQPYAIAYGDRIATPAYVNGQGPFEFLLDTACSRTIIYNHVRRRLGLSRAEG
ncbi:MAG TPA: aspartyl protease family protein, partial [Stellaceae bacterium]|nr:aspartyl protease family protein [Stellaceae bacterium]